MEYDIGMDAHSKTSVFVVLNGKGQEVVTQRIITSETEIERFWDSLKGKKHLTFEESADRNFESHFCRMRQVLPRQFRSRRCHSELRDS